MARFIECIIDGERSKIPDAFYRISIKLIIMNENGQILILKSTENDKYELPGGGLDWGEDHETTARRELKEELDLDLVKLEGKPVAEELSRHRSGYHALKIYYRCAYDGEPADTEPHKIKFQWVDLSAFKNTAFQTDEIAILKHIEAIWPQ